MTRRQARHGNKILPEPPISYVSSLKPGYIAPNFHNNFQRLRWFGVITLRPLCLQIKKLRFF